MASWHVDDGPPSSRFGGILVLVAVAVLAVALASGIDLVRSLLAGG